MMPSRRWPLVAVGHNGLKRCPAAEGAEKMPSCRRPRCLSTPWPSDPAGAPSKEAEKEASSKEAQAEKEASSKEAEEESDEELS